jgi:hypothetical protein
MKGVVARRFRLMVPHGRLAECIEYLEEGLRALQPTPYHRVLGRSFLPQTDALAAWLADFCRKADVTGLGLAAVYLEMNGFAINPQEWHCNIFGYKTAGSLWKLEWLASWDAERAERFVLDGMEPVQEAYAELFRGEEQPLSVELAEEVAEHLVTARFMELVAASHAAAKLLFDGLRGFRVLASAHDWDTVHETI